MRDKGTERVGAFCEGDISSLRAILHLRVRCSQTMLLHSACEGTEWQRQNQNVLGHSVDE